MEPVSAALVKAGGDAAIQEARSFLGKLLGPAADEAGLILQDRVRQYRFANQIKMIRKTQAMVEKAGLRAQAVPLKTLLPLLDGAALEEADDLQTKWAALLANASSAERRTNVLPSYVEILKQLSPSEARLLDAIYDHVSTELTRVYDRVDAAILSYVGSAGMHHDAVGRLYVKLEVGSDPWVPLREQPDANVATGVSEQRVRLGASLDNLIRLGLLYRELGTKYRDKYYLSTLGFEFVNACREPHPAEHAGSGPD
jgi:hypothetical protein